jgi:hypothetical protein
LEKLPCFPCKSFTGPKKGRRPDVDAAALHFIKQTHAKRIPVTWQALQVKPTKTTKSFGIINLKGG